MRPRGSFSVGTHETSYVNALRRMISDNFTNTEFPWEIFSALVL